MDATLTTEKKQVKTASHLAFEGVKGNTSEFPYSIALTIS